jgi:EpsI family protein
MIVRSLVVTTCLAATAGYLTWGVPQARPLPVIDLEQLPLKVGDWRGQSVPLDPAVLKVLPVDAYTHRYYTDSLNRRANLYVGYHDDTRPAVHLAPHSPLLCLPGLGWQPVETGRIQMRVGPRDVNGVRRTVGATQILAVRALERQVVVFWYEVNGQAAADEYELKAHLLANVLHARTSSVTLVRVAVRVEGSQARAKARAERTARDFAEHIFVDVERRLPS